MSVCIKTYTYGPLGANMYAVFSDTAFIVVDPCVDPSKIVTDLACEGIFITHGHFDHIAALDSWKAAYPQVPVYIHDDDKICISSAHDNLSADFGFAMEFGLEVRSLDEVKGKDFLGCLHFDYYHTPGHSRGSCCLSFTDSDHHFLFTGDMLFAGSVGRTDFPGSSVDSMRSSIELLKGIEIPYEVYPGHGPATMLQRETASNPFFY